MRRRRTIKCANAAAHPAMARTTTLRRRRSSRCRSGVVMRARDVVRRDTHDSRSKKGTPEDAYDGVMKISC